jgi:UDP-N-acetylglucosamine 4,6-dehydratase/5-epimerase
MKNKTILVTGGTGSFGKQFIKTLLKLPCKKIIVFSRDELKQYDMAQQYQDKRLRFFIGDVRDQDRLYRAFTGVDYVVHAAAIKQIPTAEYNPSECIKTNVYSADNLINAAIDAGVKKVVALSTDKAVYPINLYGASKLCAEKLFTAANVYSHTTRFCCVRYGNVVGSRGSVIPLFLKQKDGGELTITDDRMTRFWLTLEGAVEIVLTAIDEMQGGEVFVPKMPSMKLTDLARVICPECQIKVVGIRPGEKLHETMIIEDDARRTLDCNSYYTIQPDVKEGMNWGVKVSPSNLPADFTYRSDTNDWWLSDRDLQKFIEEAG